MGLANKNMKISILMPVYNGEPYIANALDSVLMQNVDFDYEIIVLDDGSSDNTLKIIEEYQANYNNITLLENKQNQGNSKAVYKLLTAARGKYFTILDADDFYTIKNKLQKQVDFLEGDALLEYAAVAHFHLEFCESGVRSISNNSIHTIKSSYTYLDFLDPGFYFHTSSFVYRNIFLHGGVPECFKEDLFRGDNPRTFWILLTTKAKVKVLRFVGSAYRIHEGGIWSGNCNIDNRKRNTKMFKEFQKYITSDIEKKKLQLRIKKLEISAHMPGKRNSSSEFLSVNAYLEKIKKCAQRIAYSDYAYAFGKATKSLFLDSLCESIGCIELSSFSSLNGDRKTFQSDHILIIAPVLTPRGGGIYQEILDLIELNSDSKVTIMVTGHADFSSLEYSERIIEDTKGCNFIFGKKGKNHRPLKELFLHIKAINPDTIYTYYGHDDVICSALNRSEFCQKSVNLFSVDHGFCFGLNNSSNDYYITKRPTDYHMLKPHFGKKVIYIPVLQRLKDIKDSFKPFKCFPEITTSSIAARPYKFGNFENYISMVAEVLKSTNGRHIHVGPLEGSMLLSVKQIFRQEKVSLDRFVHVQWLESLAQGLLDLGVDIFIQPQGTLSYKIAVEVMMAGIPIAYNKSSSRMRCCDFAYVDALCYANKEELAQSLSQFDTSTLIKHSINSKEQFSRYHNIDRLRNYYLRTESLCDPLDFPIVDGILHDSFPDCLSLLTRLDNNPTSKKRKSIFYKILLTVSKPFSPIIQHQRNKWEMRYLKWTS